MNSKKISFLFVLVLIFIITTILSPKILNRSDTSISPTPSAQADQISNKSNFLNLSNQNLNKLPSNVLKMSNLEELNISNNKLTGALPGEIRNLKSLRILDASFNQMTGVPAEIGQLENLEILDLSNNKLTGLPYEMANLKRLKQLNLSGNNYSKQDLEIIKKGLSPTVVIVVN